MFEMNAATNWFALMARGYRWHDRAAILLVLTFRLRPGFWRLLSKLVGERDYVITVKTPSGPARLLFNPLDASELTVLDELLPGDIYIVVQPAEVFVDCGAFRGISTIYLQDQVKAARVKAYEPQAENFAILARRLGKHLPAAVCVNAAVGVENGEVLFDGCGVGGIVGDVGNRVRMVRLRDELSAEQPSMLLVKMDIEGAEREVVPDFASALPTTCSLFLETHFVEGEAEILLAPLEAAGFSLREIRRRRYKDPNVWFIDWELNRGGVSVQR